MKKIRILLAMLISVVMMFGIAACDNGGGSGTGAPATPAEVATLQSAVDAFNAKKEYNRVTTGIQEMKMELSQSVIDLMKAAGLTQEDIDAIYGGGMKSTMSQTSLSKLSGTNVVRKESFTGTNEADGEVTPVPEETAYWANGVAYYPVTVDDGETETQEIRAKYATLRDFDDEYGANIFAPEIIDVLDSATKKGNEYTIDITDVMAEELDGLIGSIAGSAEGLDVEISMLFKITLSNNAITKIVMDTKVAIVMAYGDPEATTFNAADLSMKMVFSMKMEMVEKSTSGISISIPQTYQDAFVAGTAENSFISSLLYRLYFANDYTAKMHTVDEYGTGSPVTIEVESYSILDEEGWFAEAVYLKAIVTIHGEPDVISQPIFVDGFEGSVMCVVADTAAANIVAMSDVKSTAMFYADNIGNATDYAHTVTYNAETDEFDIVITGTLDEEAMTITVNVGVEAEIIIEADGEVVIEMKEGSVAFDNPFVNAAGFANYVDILAEQE